jgi:hypothetical protein
MRSSRIVIDWLFCKIVVGRLPKSTTDLPSAKILRLRPGKAIP